MRQIGTRIEPMAPQHIEGYRRALDVVARERIYLALLEAPPLASTAAFVAECLRRRDAFFVALDGETVVGWCDIRRKDFPSRAHCGVLGMGIVPEYRGLGLGRRLIEATLERASEVGVGRVELDVHADNLRAIALYEKVGFAREGVARDAVCVDGVYRDALYMALHSRRT